MITRPGTISIFALDMIICYSLVKLNVGQVYE